MHAAGCWGGQWLKVLRATQEVVQVMLLTMALRLRMNL